MPAQNKKIIITIKITITHALHDQEKSNICGLVPTLEEWTDFPPAGDATLVGVLSQCRLEEEKWHAACAHEEDVRDEENT